MNINICSAILTRNVLKFYYDGGVRNAEPHCHGISSTGKEVLRAFQTGGYTESGESFGWKLFDVSKIINLKTTGTTFPNNRPGYNPIDRGMLTVHCHV